MTIIIKNINHICTTEFLVNIGIPEAKNSHVRRSTTSCGMVFAGIVKSSGNGGILSKDLFCKIICYTFRLRI